MSSRTYEYRLAGHQDLRWSDWFDHPYVSTDGPDTLLRLQVADPSALYGVLMRLRDLNLTLIALHPIAPEAPHEDH